MANVYTTLSNTTVYTDKLEISTTTANATLQVYAVALGTNAAVGNLYSTPINIPANTVYQTYAGAGNKVTVVSAAAFTALELGTASSATAGVIGYGSNP
jgi:hypothetical protein